LEIHHDLRPLRLGLVGEPFADGLADCIRPVPLALFVVFHEPLHRRFEVETVVRQHGIVVDEPLGQLLVEQFEVGKEQIFVPIDSSIASNAP
jgi:hypothetical protein